MKSKFSTFDLICMITELQKLVGMRLHQIYDIDNKAYLFKFHKTDEKAVLLIESGSRIHTTAFEWPKNVAPSGFSMKMRKHLRNKRLESIKQLGIDRVVDMQFGTGDAEYHVILELYDKGNVLLTDGNLVILYVLRPHVEGEEVRFAVREKYPIDRARKPQGVISLEQLTDHLNQAKVGENLKKILNPKLEYGPALIEHALLSAGFQPNCKLGKTFDIARDVEKLHQALGEAENLMTQASTEISKGYIIQKMEKKPVGMTGEEEVFYSNQEFHPVIFKQHENQPVKEFPSFDVAVDEYFSGMESQKIDMRAVQQEKEALKKLENVRKDHVVRVEALSKAQDEGRTKAELIEKNLPLVENAILAVRAALATQASWDQVKEIVLDAAERGDPIAQSIEALKLEVNNITMKLSDPYEEENSSDDEVSKTSKPMLIDIDLDLSAYANARAYYDQKRHAAKKQQKTLDSEKKALKSAERKTKLALKEVQAITTINKARKVFWFEKFFWFISSENYLVIGGRDQVQNEVVVKKHLTANDVYVHADLQGASSVVIKNPKGGPIPPKTLNEAGVMAVSYSVAWDAKVVTSAWWVHSNQVSKTAPTGEYLTTGSFMIRGKKNYLPPCHLIMGFSFLFKLEESSVFRHADERKVRSLEDDDLELRRLNIQTSYDGSTAESIPSTNQSVASMETEEDQEIVLEDDSEDDDADKNGSGSENGGPSGEVECKDEEEDDEDGVSAFPDTQIKFEHQGGQNSIVAEGVSILNKPSSKEDDGSVVYLGDNKPIKIKPADSKKKQKKDGEERNKGNSGKQRKQKNGEKDKEPERGSESEGESKVENQVKRGQKGKLKKIKEKYKYQDEEERKLRMEILQSAGSAKETSRKKSKQEQGSNRKNAAKKKGGNRIGLVPFSGHGVLLGDDQDIVEMENGKVVVKEEQDDIDDDEEAVPTTTEEMDLLLSLTGQPVTEDELLFAVPTVAPYNALANHKFKVKLTPGTGRRGKAAKTALNMFMKDKSTTPREKDLLRSVKDQDIARNIPGKVKVSAPMLQKSKK